MSNVIDLQDYRPTDQILWKGDLVRLVSLPGYPEYEGSVGLVIGIPMRFGPDSDAPGQAAAAKVAIPLEDGWETIDSVGLDFLIRVIGLEADQFHSYAEDELQV